MSVTRQLVRPLVRPLVRSLVLDADGGGSGPTPPAPYQDYADLVNASGPVATWNLAGAPERFDGTRKEPIGTPAQGQQLLAGPFTAEWIASVDVLDTDMAMFGSFGSAGSPERRLMLFMDEGGAGPSFCAAWQGNTGVMLLNEDPSAQQPTIEVGKEYHVAIASDGTTIEIFIDGVEIASGTIDLRVLAAPVQLWIGSAGPPTDMFLQGTERGAAIFDSRLSDADILAHAQLSGSGGTLPAPPAPPPEPEPLPYDLDAHTAAELIAFIEADFQLPHSPGETAILQDLIDAERAGQNRPSLVTYLDALPGIL